MISRRFALAITATLIVATIACNLQQTPVATPSPTVTVTPAGILSPTPLVGTAAPGLTNSPTGRPATQAPPPVPTATLPAGGVGSATRVTFTPGATFAIVNGNLAANGTIRYLVNVAAGQLVDVSSSSTTQPQIAVTGADGKVLQNVLKNSVAFRGVAPSTQDYIITITGGTQAMAYSIEIMIPERITFAQGDTEEIVSGSVAANSIHQYVINLKAGQLLDLTLVPQTGVHTQIYGVDGDVLQSGMGGGASFRGTVASSQDYVIQVISEGSTVTYSMTVMVPQRITFAAGATSIDLQGTLDTHHSFEYVINIQAGQVLDISPNTAQTSIGLVIYGADGTVLKSQMSNSASFRGKVPATQDYVIQLLGGTQATSYDMSLIVAQRISFAAGATSATLTGSLKPHETHYFMVSATANQTLDVAFTPEGSAKMSIYGVDGTVLWSGMGEGTHFSGKLPSTQDYYINFQAGDQAVQFQLVVTIK